jgi:hypothetical protein
VELRENAVDTGAKRRSQAEIANRDRKRRSEARVEDAVVTRLQDHGCAGVTGKELRKLRGGHEKDDYVE